MSNQIDDMPHERTFGKSFDYTQWSGKTSYASLYRVPWSSDNRDIAYFPTHSALHDYLATRPMLARPDFSYLKYGQPVKFDIPFNEVLKYNYLVVYNPEQPITSNAPDSARWLYYFVNDVVYDSPNSTRLVLQLDVVQTFLREVRFGQAYIEQGHVGIADSNIKVGEQGVLTQPEGLNLGADYTVVDQKEFMLARAGAGATFKVMVVSSTDLEAEGGTKTEPILKTATGSDFENLPNGANIYIFENPGIFISYIDSMSDKPWVTQGIISVTALPFNIEAQGQTWPRVTLNGHQALKPGAADAMRITVTPMWNNFKNAITEFLAPRHKHLKKFSVYPYSMFEVSTYTGEPLVLKPELWKNSNAEMVIKFHFAPPSPRIGIRPYNYNTEQDASYTPGVDPDNSDRGEGWNVATWISNFPQFSVVNNGYLQTMASQAHAISQSYKDAGWSQQKALTGNTLAYDQSTSGMNLANDLTQNSTTALGQQTALSNMTTGAQALRGGAMSIAGGAAGGAVGLVAGATSALNGAMGAGIQINQNNQSTAIQQRLMNAQNQSQVGQQGYVRDTNKNFADYASKGDYQNTINAINAKVEDAKLTQPTASGTSGGDAFTLAITGWAVRMKLKTVPRGARETMGDYWLRYGYAINRFASFPGNYQCCTLFTYWKVKESYVIDAQCPEPVKQALRGIFEKGVTVWHDATRMGDPTAIVDNEPIYRIYLPYT